MPTPPSSGAAAADRPPMPTSVRVAVVLLAVLAVLLLLNAGLIWFGREVVVDQIVAAQPRISRDDARNDVVTGVVVRLLIGVLAGLSAWALAEHRAWGRWGGLATGVALAALTLVSIVSVGGLTVSSLLVLVLSVATVASVLARPTAQWAPARAPATR